MCGLVTREMSQLRMLARDYESSAHENVYCAKYVAIYDKRAWYSSRENYSVRVTKRQDHASVQVRSNRKAVRLRRILVTDKQSNNIPLMHMNHGPRIHGRPMTNTIIEA